MRSFTDVFIKHPVLAVVVNLVIVLVGWRALTTLPLQQYPKIESSSVVITTVYYGASAETVRGFLTTPIERVVSAIGGVDYVESTSRAGVSTVTVHLKLNHSSTAALAEVTARLQQVRSELPAEAEPPAIEVQRADRPYASFYLSFTSSERSVPAITDWLLRTLQPQLSTLSGVQRVTIEGGRQIAMRVWIDPDRLAVYNLSPGDVQAALRRNNYLAAVGRTKGNLVQVNLLANTDLRSADEFEKLIVADRGGAIVRLSDVARVELGAEEADMVAKYNDQEGVYLGVWPLVGSNEIEVAHRLRDEMERIRPTLPKDIDMRLVWDGTMFMENALKEITKTLGETILIVAIVVFLFMGSMRTALVPLVAMPVSLIGAAIFMFAFGFSLNLLTILAIVLSVGLVVDDAIVVVENVERHVRLGKSRIEAALTGARELIGPIIAMTITLATVYAPIGFQGGLTGSLFLEFAITLAAAVVLSGIVAVTLSPVMSSRFVHPQGKEGRLTSLVNRAFEFVRRAYARLLDRALEMRWAIVTASLLIMVAAWPLYMFSRQELAPVEDQSHISLFLEASPDSTLAATNRDSLKIVGAIRSFPEARFMWSLATAWGGFGGMVAKDWRERTRSTEEIYGEVFGAVSQVPGLRIFPRLDPPLPTAGQYDVELVLQSDAPVGQMLETTAAVLGAGWQSGKFLYVDTDLKIDLPEARVVLDRERLADLGLDLAGVGRELGTLLGGAYVNRFNFFDRSYKVIPQIGDKDRATIDPLLDLKIKTPGGQLVPVSTFTHIESNTAPRTLNRFQQRNSAAGLRRGQARRHEGGGVARARGRCGHGGRPARHPRLRGRVAADPTRGIGAHRHARVRARAHLFGARGAVPELSRPADRPAGLGAARDLRRAGVQLPRSHHDQHLLPGRADHAGGIDREERYSDRGVREHAAGPRSLEGGCATRGVAHAAATGADDLGGHGLWAPPPGAGVRPRSRGPQQYRDCAGHRHDHRDSVHPVHRAGLLLAHRGSAPAEPVTRGDRTREAADRSTGRKATWRSDRSIVRGE